MTIITPSAPKLALDLSRYIAKHVLGDITAIMTWTTHNQRPCIVLIPTFTPLHFDRVTPCIVPLENAWAWDETTGDGAHAARTSCDFACSLGFSPSPQMLMRITGTIRDLLGDLLMMPVMPAFYDTSVMADATLTNLDTGKVHQKEITEDV
jgi:hypothetical protein